MPCSVDTVIEYIVPFLLPGVLGPVTQGTALACSQKTVRAWVSRRHIKLPDLAGEQGALQE